MTAAAGTNMIFAHANPYGHPLEEQDYRDLSSRWIDRAAAETAMLRRVPDHEGREVLMERRRDCAGILIPYFWPGESNMYTLRIRRDRPEMEGGKPSGKYLSARGDRNRLYFVAGTEPAALSNLTIPIIITEGEFKAIALSRLACHNASTMRFLPIGVSGVWNWKGTIGIATDEKGERVQEKGVIPDISRIEWAGRRVIIAFDADAGSNAQVRAARHRLSQELRSRGAVVGILEWEEPRGKGVDDWLANDGPDAVLKAIEGVDFDRTTGWKAKLKCTARGKVKPSHLNVDIALRSCPEWEGAIGFDEFRQIVRVIAHAPIGGTIPRDWTDDDDTQTTIWMQENGIDVGPAIVAAAIHSVAMSNRFNPVCDWLNSLVWDGVHRVDDWLTQYLGASPSPYSASVGRMWLVSAVARIEVPGCKADHMLVLEGPQGIGKSRALRILAGDENFCDSMPDIRSKDAQIQTFGSWVIEWGELDAMSRADTTAVKDFISRQTEKVRRPYGRHTERVPRQCVFAGTTNTGDYLRDETGNRRFWPVICGRIDCQRLAEDREQLWAEAVAMYRHGVKWWPEGTTLIAALADEQAQRVQVDPWLDRIERFVDGLDEIKAERILTDCLEIELSRQGQGERNRVGRCLRQIGWKPAQWRNGNTKVRGFRRAK